MDALYQELKRTELHHNSAVLRAIKFYNAHFAHNPYYAQCTSKPNGYNAQFKMSCIVRVSRYSGLYSVQSNAPVT